MAPRRGGGGGGGFSFSNGCSGAFATDDPDSTPIPYFVSYCLFFLVTTGTLIAWCVGRKSRKLVGPIYGLALFLMWLRYALAIIGTTIRECKKPSYDWAFYNWELAWNLFWQLSVYLLLVVTFWGVNSLLRYRLGHSPRFFTVLYAVVLGVMGALTAAYAAIQSYDIWTLTEDGWYTDSLIETELKLGVAYWVLFLVVVVAGGALAIASLVSMRSRGMSTSHLLPGTIALTLSMFIWTLFIVIESVTNLQSRFLGTHVYDAFLYIEDVFLALSFILLLYVASAAHKAGGDAGVPQAYPQYPTQQQQPAYAPVPVQQHQHYQAPELAPQQYYYPQAQTQQGGYQGGGYAPVNGYGNGNGQVVHGK